MLFKMYTRKDTAREGVMATMLNVCSETEKREEEGERERESDLLSITQHFGRGWEDYEHDACAYLVWLGLKSGIITPKRTRVHLYLLRKVPSLPLLLSLSSFSFIPLPHPSPSHY